MSKQSITTKPIEISSYYTDISNNTRVVKQSVLLNDKEKKTLEEDIVEELVEIFTHKVD